MIFPSASVPRLLSVQRRHSVGRPGDTDSGPRRTSTLAIRTTTKSSIRRRCVEKQPQIVQTVGEELDWDRLDDRRASRISLYFPDRLRVTDEVRWPEARAWLIQAMGKMRSAFDPVLEEL